MYKSSILYTALLLTTKVFALSCSAPITVSDSKFNSIDPHISANEKGDAVVVWESRLRSQGAVTVAHKMQNSAWAPSEIISDWYNGYTHGIRRHVSPDGTVRLLWKSYGDDSVSCYHYTEQTAGKPWSQPVRFASSFPDLNRIFKLKFDSLGKLFLIGTTETEYTTQPAYSGGYNYTKSHTGLTILNIDSFQSEQHRNTVLLEKNRPIFWNISLAMNQNEVSYVFWADNKTIVGQKISGGRFISKPESIYEFDENLNIFEIRSRVNNKNDIVVTCFDSDKNGMIMTRFKDTWSPPFLFTTEDKNVYQTIPVIDDEGNIMVVYRTTIDTVNIIKAIYKPFGQPWMAAVEFHPPEGDASNEDPKVTTDGKGNFVVLWTQEVRNRYGVFGTTFSTQAQEWSSPQLLSPAGISCDDYCLTFWAPGKGYISWAAKPNGFDTIIQVAELSN